MAAQRQTDRLRLTPRSVVLAVAMFGAALAMLRLVVASQRVIGWVLAAAAIAGLLRPAVARLDRRIPHGLAVAVVVLLTVGAGTAVTYATVDGVVRQARNLQRVAPQRAAELERSERFGELARELNLEERTRSFVRGVPERLRGGTPADALRSAATRGVAFLATGVLTIFLLLHGPRIAHAAGEQIPDRRRREQAAQVALAGFRRGMGYTRGSIGMAALAGLTAYGLARAAEVPGPAPLALWVAVWDLVPLLGVFVGAFPIIALAAVTSTTTAALLVLAFLAYQVAEFVFLQRPLERRTVRVGPFLTVAGGFAGLELYGIGGALLVLVFIAVAVAVADELAPEPGS